MFNFRDFSLFFSLFTKQPPTPKAKIAPPADYVRSDATGPGIDDSSDDEMTSDFAIDHDSDRDDYRFERVGPQASKVTKFGEDFGDDMEVGVSYQKTGVKLDQRKPEPQRETVSRDPG